MKKPETGEIQQILADYQPERTPISESLEPWRAVFGEQPPSLPSRYGNSATENFGTTRQTQAATRASLAGCPGHGQCQRPDRSMGPRQ